MQKIIVYQLLKKSMSKFTASLQRWHKTDSKRTQHAQWHSMYWMNRYIHADLIIFILRTSLYVLQLLNFRFGNALDPWEMPSNPHITACISHRGESTWKDSFTGKIQGHSKQRLRIFDKMKGQSLYYKNWNTTLL